MQIYFSTVIRDAPPRLGGELVQLDWKTKLVKRQVPITAMAPDLNDLQPGSSTRGGRGIQILNDQVIVASYHTLKIFDRALSHRRDVSHPLMVGLHEICLDGTEKVWVTCTGIDATLQIDLSNNNLLRQFWPTEMPKIQQRLDVTPLEIDKQADNRTLFLDGPRHKSNRLHLNAVAVWQGEVYVLFAKHGTVVNLDRQEIVIQDSALRGGHNLIIDENGVAIVNNTHGRAIMFYDLKSRALVRTINLTEFTPIRTILRRHKLTYFARRALHRLDLYPHTPPCPVFVRGLCLFDDDLFVGVSPASVLRFSWQQGKLIDMYSYSKDVHTCVHGLKVVADE